MYRRKTTSLEINVLVKVSMFTEVVREVPFCRRRFSIFFGSCFNDIIALQVLANFTEYILVLTPPLVFYESFPSLHVSYIFCMCPISSLTLAFVNKLNLNKSVTKIDSHRCTVYIFDKTRDDVLKKYGMLFS